jgi:hypothetical protein
MNVITSNTTITNLELSNPFIGKVFDEQVQSLNLRNVILRGADLTKLSLKSGQWENVWIYPPVKVSDTDFRNLKVHNLVFPEGEPWVDETNGTNLNFKESPTPFDWPEVHVPTPIELGLVS